MRANSPQFLAATFGAIFSLATSLSGAITNYVTTTADSGPGSLRQAIADSSSGDAIQFRTNGIITLLSGELQITNNLTIIGTGVTNLAISGNGSSRVFYISAETTSSISGLTIRDGRTTNGANGASAGGTGTSGASGGGVYNLGTLALNDCIITANTTGYGGNGSNGAQRADGSGGPGGSGGSGGHGAGLYNGGFLIIHGSVLAANRTGNGGNGGDGSHGAWFVDRPSSGGGGGLGGSGGFGGGIYNSGVLTLNACTLSANVTGSGGNGSLGGVGGLGCDPLCHGGPSGQGGPGGTGGGGAGIWNGQGTVTATNCTFESNLCGMGGIGPTNRQPLNGLPGVGGSGGGVGNNGMLAVSVCTFHGNSGGANGVYQGGTSGAPAGYGGGVFNGINSTAIVSICTISGNSSGYGCGIFNDGSLLVVASTIANNDYSTTASGIDSHFGTCCFTTLRDTLVAGNSSYDVRGSFISEGHNLIGLRGQIFSLRTNGCKCDLVGTLSARIDPLLGPLQDNGGPVFTHALLAGSPAIDAGINTGVAFEARGQPRTIDNPAVTNAFGGDGTDIGAFEVNHTLTGTETRRTGDDIQVRFTTVSDKTYGVEYRLEVGEGSWIELPGTAAGTGGIVTYTDANAATLSRRFYRIFERAP